MTGVTRALGLCPHSKKGPSCFPGHLRSCVPVWKKIETIFGTDDPVVRLAGAGVNVLSHQQDVAKNKSDSLMDEELYFQFIEMAEKCLYEALNVLLEEYRGDQEGPEPNPKLKENVGGKIYRIKNFIAFMAVGHTNLSSLLFLNDTPRIRGWISRLRACKMKETTIKHYVLSVAQFISYVKAPSNCRLSRSPCIKPIRRSALLRNELVGGPDARFFFFTSTPNPCKNLNSYFQAPWAEMNLPGCPTFTDIRSSIATHARNAHTADDRLKISRFMCHDTKIADRFYAINLNPRQALEHRRLFEAALEGPELSPVKQEPKRKHAGRKAAKPRKRAREEESPADSPRSQSSESSASSEGEDVEAESHTDSDMEEQAEPGTSATQIQASPRRMRQRAMVILSPLKKKSSPFKAKVSKSFTPEGLAKASEARERVKAVLKLRSGFCRK